MDDINKILNNRDQSVILYNFKAKINFITNESKRHCVNKFQEKKKTKFEDLNSNLTCINKF
jgi:hypothetical protein